MFAQLPGLTLDEIPRTKKLKVINQIIYLCLVLASMIYMFIESSFIVSTVPLAAVNQCSTIQYLQLKLRTNYMGIILISSVWCLLSLLAGSLALIMFIIAWVTEYFSFGKLAACVFAKMITTMGSALLFGYFLALAIENGACTQSVSTFYAVNSSIGLLAMISSLITLVVLLAERYWMHQKITEIIKHAFLTGKSMVRQSLITQNDDPEQNQQRPLQQQQPLQHDPASKYVEVSPEKDVMNVAIQYESVTARQTQPIQAFKAHQTIQTNEQPNQTNEPQQIPKAGKTPQEIEMTRYTTENKLFYLSNKMSNNNYAEYMAQNSQQNPTIKISETNSLEAIKEERRKTPTANISSSPIQAVYHEKNKVIESSKIASNVPGQPYWKRRDFHQKKEPTQIDNANIGQNKQANYGSILSHKGTEEVERGESTRFDILQKVRQEKSALILSENKANNKGRVLDMIRSRYEPQ